MAEKEFKYKVHEHIAILKESETSDWTLELNLVGFGKNCDDVSKAKYDIRNWKRSLDEPVMGKGVTLTKEELVALGDALVENGFTSDSEEDEDDDE